MLLPTPTTAIRSIPPPDMGQMDPSRLTEPSAVPLPSTAPLASFPPLVSTSAPPAAVMLPVGVTQVEFQSHVARVIIRSLLSHFSNAYIS